MQGAVCYCRLVTGQALSRCNTVLHQTIFPRSALLPLRARCRHTQGTQKDILRFSAKHRGFVGRSNMSNWSCLPTELLCFICSFFVNIDEINKFCEVCINWRRAGRMTKTKQICRENNLFSWKNLGTIYKLCPIMMTHYLNDNGPTGPNGHNLLQPAEGCWLHCTLIGGGGGGTYLAGGHCGDYSDIIFKERHQKFSFILFIALQISGNLEVNVGRGGQGEAREPTPEPHIWELLAAAPGEPTELRNISVQGKQNFFQ